MSSILLFEIYDIDLITEKMQTWIPDIYVDLVKNFMKFIEMYRNLVNEFLKFSEPVYSWISLNFTKFTTNLVNSL